MTVRNIGLPVPMFLYLQSAYVDGTKIYRKWCDKRVIFVFFLRTKHITTDVLRISEV